MYTANWKLTDTIHSFIHQWLYSPLLGPGLLFSFVIFFTQPVGLLGWVISLSQGRYLHRTKQTQNKRTQTSMPWVEFEPMLPVFERAKTVHALDRAATVIGHWCLSNDLFSQAVSRWLPTAAARVRARVWSSGICGGQNGAGAGFLRVLRFLLPIFIPPIAPQSPSSVIWGCTIGQQWPQYLVT
jgi:hypothetical protein